MKIIERVTVPTGDILIVEGECGQLECLSLGDYGKDVNIKCAALGLDRPLDPVRHTALLPLTKKWVVTISTQYGCSMGCTFCDVPKVGPGRNATFADMRDQILTAMSLHPEVRRTERLNIHFARMGEPAWNGLAVVDCALWIADTLRLRHDVTHPVVSTMLPARCRRLRDFVLTWMRIKNNTFDGDAGLQLSINSTDDHQRHIMFGGAALPLDEVAQLFDGVEVRGRKITLNFAVAEGYETDPDKLLRAGFDTERFLVKLTPMHKTRTALARGIETAGDYTTYEPYDHHEQALRAAGYDVLVFIASREEDEGLITCGNAILSGSRPAPKYVTPGGGA